MAKNRRFGAFVVLIANGLSAVFLSCKTQANNAQTTSDANCENGVIPGRKIHLNLRGNDEKRGGSQKRRKNQSDGRFKLDFPAVTQN